jgi:uroporphyrinogen decarboxylase
MTGKELLKRAIRLEETERIPWVPFAGVHAACITGVDAMSYLRSEELIINGVESAVKLYNADGIPVVFDLQLEAEALGCDLLWAENNPPSVISHPLAAGVALNELSIPSENEGRIALVMNAAAKLVKRNPKTAFYGLVTGPFTLALHLSGTDIFMQMFTDPQKVHQIMEFCTDVCKAMSRYYHRAGVDVIALVDPMTSQIGTEQFLEFVSPCASEIFSKIRSLGLLSSFFVCGDAQHNIEAMCDCLPDNISVDENIPLVYVRDICLSRGISFGGNLRLTTTLLMGTAFDCEKDALECLDAGGRKGYILSPGCDLPFDTVKENLIAVSELAGDSYRQDVVREMGKEEIIYEPLDLEKYASGTNVKVDIITLDSSSCAPCQYMTDAAVRAASGLEEKVHVKEYKIKTQEGIIKMRQFGLENIPAICIDGEPVFVSRIPPVEDIRKAILQRVVEKER